MKDMIKRSLRKMADRAIDKNSIRVRSEYIRQWINQADHIILDAANRHSDDLAQQEEIDILKQKAEELERIIQSDPSNDKAKYLLARIKKLIEN